MIYKKKYIFTKFIHNYLTGYYEWRISVDHQQTIRRDFVEFLHLKNNESLIEFGCGPGNFLELVAPHCRYATGLDESISMLRRAEKRIKNARLSNVNLIHASIGSYAPHQQYHCAVGVGFLYLFQRPLEILRKMKASVKPGGFVSTMCPSDAFTKINISCYIEKKSLNSKEQFVIQNWLLAAQLNNRFPDDKIKKLYDDAGLQNIQLKHTLDRMVVFAKGRI